MWDQCRQRCLSASLPARGSSCPQQGPMPPMPNSSLYIPPTSHPQPSAATREIPWWSGGLRASSWWLSTSRAHPRPYLPPPPDIGIHTPDESRFKRVLTLRHGNQYHRAPAQCGLGAGGGAALRRLGHQQSLRHRPGGRGRGFRGAATPAGRLCADRLGRHQLRLGLQALPQRRRRLYRRRPALAPAGHHWRPARCWRISSSPPP